MSPALEGGSFAVVGGASLIGSTIARQLLAARAREIVLVDDFSLGRREAIEDLLEAPPARAVVADITRLEELLPALEGVDGVFHVAALLTSRLAPTPGRGIDVNMRGTLSVLEACRTHGVAKVVLSSTVGVYGTAGGGITEDTGFLGRGMHPATAIYSLSKLVSESLCELYRQRHGIDYVALRYSSVYGPGLHRRALNTSLLLDAHERIRRGEAPRLEGDGADVHDYVYVGDVAWANLLAMSRPVSGEAVTIATGTATTTRQALQVLIETCGADLAIESVAAGASPRYAGPADTRYDVEKARRLLEWTPRVDLREGLRRLVESLDVAAPA